MDIILAAALATCALDPSNCRVEDFRNGTLIHVCNIAPEQEAKDINFVARVGEEVYYFTLSPRCKII